MIVARVNSIKEETHTLMDLQDLEVLIINTMGEDTWNAIKYFTESKVEKLNNELLDKKEEAECDDSIIFNLRAGIRDEIEVLNELITYIDDSARLNRIKMITELHGIIQRLEDNEGYL